MSLEALYPALTAALVAVFILWLVSLKLRDVSIIDIWWAPGFALVGWVYATGVAQDSLRGALCLAVVTAWALRLGGHLFRRNIGHGEDSRYAAMRRASPHFAWTSLVKVFGLQGSLQVLIALPIYGAISSLQPMGLSDVLCLALACSGLVIEAVADEQLRQFKAQPNSKGQVMDRGLWAWSRHPNYFGNAVLWVGLGGLALAAGAPWWTFLGPAVMIFLLLRVSGVSMLESTIVDRRPAYREYQERVSSFILWPPKPASAHPEKPSV